MGRLAKASLVGALSLTTFTIWFVHTQQTDERERMYAGVVRDDKRRQEKIEQRLKDLQESQTKRAIYERVQKVESSSES